MPLGTHRSRGTLALGFVVLAALLAFALSGGSPVHAQGSPPPGPVTYSGTVTVGGSPAPDGLSIVARIPESQPQRSTRTTSRLPQGHPERREVQEPDRGTN